MQEYNIVLAHGPVSETEYLGDDAVSYTLEDGRVFNIRFSIAKEDGCKLYKRAITTEGTTYTDAVEWDVFDENLTCEDFAQWTADNFEAEILDCLESMPILEE